MAVMFVALCNFWSLMSYYMWVGDYTKASDTSKQIDETAKNHRVLNFFTSNLYPFFV